MILVDEEQPQPSHLPEELKKPHDVSTMESAGLIEASERGWQLLRWTPEVVCRASRGNHPS